MKQISWQQGLFLQPQHFQLIDLHHDLQRASYMQLTHANCWGSNKIMMDKSLLQDQKVNFISGSILFKSGVLVNISEDGLIVPRSFSASWSNRSKPLKIYIGIKIKTEQGSNVSTCKSWDEIDSVQSRWAVLEQPDAVKDFYFNGPDAFIKQQVFVLRLLWEHELEDSPSYEVVPVAQIIQRGDQIIIDNKYIPPCLALSSYFQLSNMIKDLRDDLYARAKQLELYKSPKTGQDNVAVTHQWYNLLALQVFNRYIPLISHMLVVDPVPPADCFAILLQLIGELKLFDQDDDKYGTDKSMGLYFYEYKHDELTHLFAKVRDVIFKLCDNITFVPHQFFSLDFVDEFYTVDLPSSIFTSKTSYYLRVHAEGASASQLTNIDLTNKIKVGSIVSISTIVDRALSGISLELLDDSPAGVPKDFICIYCRLDTTADEWRSIVSSQSISVFWPEAIDGAKIDFVAVRS